MRRPSSRLGEIIRRQREFNRLTLRQFAALAGISNPYLSQIERGLRTPSEKVVHAIAQSLKVTPEDLYAEAGLPQSPAPGDDDARARVEAVLAADPALSPRHRRVLLDVYDGLVATGAARRPTTRPPRPREGDDADGGDHDDEDRQRPQRGRTVGKGRRPPS